ncbi:gluconate 2-dehydrogenase subunit 3 family protein [Parapedobacter pyrenivorans]|nr:gluconate 2-dehydrogenase subunit 3 family protein [Parapedobacter pyrenivorans]
MKRRDALKAIGVSVMASGLLFHRCSSEKANRVVSRINLDLKDGRELWERERFEELNSYTFFDQHEKETLVELVDLILPADEHSLSASEVEVPDFIEFIVKDQPELQQPMREGLKWIDDYAKQQFQAIFVGITIGQKTHILDRIAYPEQERSELQLGISFFTLLRELTASGYFTSKAGIDYLGYVGNRPNVWEGVPTEILRQFQLTHLIT